MTYRLLAAALAACVLSAAAVPVRAPAADIVAIVADPGRPAADRALDAARRPAELLRFIGVRPGDKVVDVFPGDYWDRLFSRAVGPAGKVYAFLPLESAKEEKIPVLPNGSRPLDGYANVSTIAAPINAFAVPEPVDVVWIRQNYHDLYDPFMGPADVPAFNRAVYKALRSGGLYVIIDHAAPDGSGLSATNTTHRIDAAVVKKDMAEAGFVFAGQSEALRNPADTREKLVFDPSIRGRTDQFVYLFRKP